MGKIIWLASYPKSGNTWMRAFLHNLLRNPDEGYDINRMTDFSFSDSTIEIFRPFLKKPWQEWSQEDVTNTRWAAQRYICSQRLDDQFIKTHNALIEYGGKPMIYPEFTAGAIYIVRNPLDVAISLAHHYVVDLDEGIRILNNHLNGTLGDEKLVFEIHRSWNMHVESWTTQVVANKLFVRYEDMLERPRPTFGKVAKFLGLKPTPERLIRAIENSSFEKLRKQEDSRGFVERPPKAEKFFRSGKANQWRNVLSPEQIERVVEVNREQMKKWGYLPLPK
jgi:hypothetical protein